MSYIWCWLIIGLLGYIAGAISDSILYQRKIKLEGVDIAILIFSLTLGPVVWVLVISSIIEHKAWNQRRKDNGKK